MTIDEQSTQAGARDASGVRRADDEDALIARELERALAAWDALDKTQPLLGLTGATAADAALALLAERWFTAVESPRLRKHRCGWCWRAAGRTDEAWTALPDMPPDEAAAHALTCTHNPTAEVIAAAKAYVTAPPAISTDEGDFDPPREAYERLCAAIKEYDHEPSRELAENAAAARAERSAGK